MDNLALHATPSFLSVVLCVVLALLVLARTQRTVVHWAFAAALGALAVAQAGNGFSLMAESPQQMLEWRRIALLGEILMPLSWLMFSLTFGRANAWDLLRDWRVGLLATGILTLLFLPLAGSDRMLSLVFPEPDTAYVSLESFGKIFACLYLISQVLIIANLEQTLRHADEVTRWHIKFPVVGLGLLCGFYIYQMSDLLLYSVWHPGLAWLESVISAISCILIGFGLLRRPMPDIEIYVSRKVLSGSLTFLIVGGALFGTGLVSGIIRYSGMPGKVVLSVLFSFMAATGLAFVLLSTNLRHALGRLVERHFFPHKYDYRARWMEATETIGDPGRPEQIARRAIELFKAIFGPQSVSIWMAVDTDEDAWASIGAYKTEGAADRLKGTGSVRAWLEAQKEPRVLRALHPEDSLPSELETALASMHPAVIAPLKAGARSIGWVALGPNRGMEPYGQQDLDLLRCIAAQVADRLQHLLTADRVVIAREMEAVYESSTFFLHDLKNFTNTLSLVTQNATRRGGAPKFQQAAMETVTATVQKMKSLIGKLTALSRDPHLKRELLDLNVLVNDVLKSLDGATDAKLVRETQPVPPVIGDPEQLQQVLLNLVLNACEVLDQSGTITVRTETEGELVRLVVEDNGCGMAPETVAELFHPFRTFRGGGLGIGLYQCRKIVEAHNGALEVDSAPGKGSRFMIRFPACREERPAEAIKAHG